MFIHVGMHNLCNILNYHLLFGRRMCFFFVDYGHNVVVHLLNLLLQYVIFAEARDSAACFLQYFFRHRKYDAHEVWIVEALKC